MFSRFLPFTLCLILGLALSHASVAQIIIEDDDTQVIKDVDSFRILDYLSVNLGYSKAESIISREILIGEINWEQNFLDNQLFFEARLDFAMTELKFNLTRNAQADAEIANGTLNENLPESLSIKRKVDAGVGLEFSFSYSGLTNIQAKAGYFTPSIGQFGVVSLVSLILPFSSEFVGYSFDKNDLFAPQLATSFAYFLTDNLQLSVYTSGDVELDPIFYEFVAEFLSDPDNEMELTGDQGRDILESGPNTFVRLLWQPSWGAVGATYSQGVNAFDVVSRDTIGCSEYINDMLVPCSSQLDDYADDAELFFYRQYTEQAYVPNQEAISFEFSINRGQITWITELLYAVTQTSIQEFEIGEIKTKSEYVDTTEEYFSTASLYLYFDNAGKLNFETESIYLGSGIEYRSKNNKTTIIAQLLSLTNRYDAQYNRIVDTLNSADGFLEGGVIPTFLVNHDHTLFGYEATSSYGLGFFGGFGGIFYNESMKLNDNISVSAGLTSTLSFGEALLIFSELTEYYDFDNSAGIGLVFGAVINY